MGQSEKMILMDSPEAAEYRTNISGWVSAGGHYHGKDERAARYAGCTHRKCEECKTVLPKNRLVCDVCYSKKRAERFKNYPLVEWNCVTPLNLFDTDEYFFDADSVADYAEDQDVKVSDLKLVLCVPHHPDGFDANDLFQDYLAEDCGVEDDAVLTAVEKLNKALEAARPFSWMPGKKRVILAD